MVFPRTTASSPRHWEIIFLVTKEMRIDATTLLLEANDGSIDTKIIGAEVR